MYLWGVVYQSSTPNDGSYKYITDNLIQKYMEYIPDYLKPFIIHKDYFPEWIEDSWFNNPVYWKGTIICYNRLRDIRTRSSTEAPGFSRATIFTTLSAAAFPKPSITSAASASS